MRKPLLWVLALAAGLLVPSAFAQFGQNWLREHNDSSGVRIRQGTHIEWSRAMTEGENGSWYFSWSDTRNGLRGLYMGKVDANGNLLWSMTVNDGSGRQEDPVLQAVPGGCVIAWIDYRNDGYGGAVYAQKITSTGQRAWAANQTDSVSAVVVAEAINIQIDLRILPDGNDGVFLFWEDFRRGLGADIWGARLLGNGQLAPGFRENGTPVAVAAAHQPYDGDYTVDVDNRGGAWVAWVDNRTSGDPNVYLQRMRADGTLLWDSTGHPLITAAGEQTKLKLAPDGRGGAFLIWRNAPPGEQNVELFMQRIDSLGAARWAPADSGVALTNVEGNQTNPRIVYASQDTCIVAWEDFRSDPGGNTNDDIYINKVTGVNSINKLWGANGAPVCVNTSHQREMRLASDGQNGAILVWEDERLSSESDSYAQRIGSNGQPLWITDGKCITDQLTIGVQNVPLCRESDGRLLFMWSDSRFGSMPIYRSTWDLNGNVVGGHSPTGELTATDVTWNVKQNVVLSNEGDRFISVWVDSRWLPFGNRIYYAINHSMYPINIGTMMDGNPATLDTNNRISQDGGQQFSEPIVVPTPAPDKGAIILYVQAEGDMHTIRGQKINRDGDRLWGNFGVGISSDLVSPDYLSGVPDDNGGAAFVCTAVNLQSANFYNVVRYQHVNSSGQALLPVDGVIIDTVDHEQSSASIVKSGNNYYVAYTELYDDTNYYYAVRVAKINLDGSRIWLRTVVDGAQNNSTGNRQRVQLIPGSNGGVVVYWQEYRSDSNNGGQIYAQKVNSDGTVAWATGGVRLGASQQDQATATATITHSGNSYWFGWKDVRIAGEPQIYVQHVNDAGQLLLDTTGIRANPMPAGQTQLDVSLAMDTTNGVFAAWTQYIAFLNPQPPPDSITDAEIKGTHLSATGTVLNPEIWSSPSTEYSGWWVHFTYKQLIPKIAPDEWHGAVGNWLDMRSTGKDELVNLYGQRVADPTSDIREVQNAELPNDYTLEQNWPNPFNSATTFKFSIPNQENVKVVIYDVTGREVTRLLDARIQAGTYQVKWFGKNEAGQKVASGIYFYRLETKKAALTRKLALIN